jgi:hypothetical protein
MKKLTETVLAVLMVVAGATGASAQVFGTFTWQMQPYCNRVTLTLTSVTGNFTLDGSDDQCGGTKKGSATGIGVFNPDGTVGLNFTIVPSTGLAVHIAASVSPANGQGTWTDDLGNVGTFAFFANTPGLPPRPAFGPAVAQSGQVFSGHLSAVRGATTSFSLVHGSYPVPLPVGVAAPVLEYRAASTTSANCPGIGQAASGYLCIYAFNASNTSNATFGGGNTAASRRFGFSLDVFPTSSGAEGYIIANWAYRVP